MCMQWLRTYVSHGAHMHACLWVDKHHAADTIVPGTSPQAAPGQRCIMEWLSICDNSVCLALYRLVLNRHYTEVSIPITQWHGHNKMAAFGLRYRGACIMCAKVVRM